MTATIDIQLRNQPVDQLPPIDPFPQPAGGECIFFGRTRHEVHPEHGALVRLSYEAYEPMAHSVLTELAQEAITRFGCFFVRVYHALGEVPPGKASVAVQVITGHRAEAFAACRFLIDELKQRAPIWKREQWADGSTWSQGTPVSREAPR